jgi:polysaccharide pyruvyl transferase WcaK-like protein
MITNKIGLYYAVQRLLSAMKNQKKAPMSIIGCNIGPFLNGFAEFLSKIEMNKYSLITVREKLSYNFLKKNIKKVASYCLPDIVFGLPDEWIPKNSGEGCLGISAYRRNNLSNFEFYAKMAKVADSYINKHNKKVLIFAFDIENENDLVAAYTIRDLCENKDMVEIIPHNDNGDNTIKNLARCSKMITVRFHSAVMALRMGIPFVPVFYSKKTNNMLDDLHFNGDRFSIKDFDENALIHSLESIKPFVIDCDVFEQAKMHTKIFEREMLI